MLEQTVESVEPKRPRLQSRTSDRFAEAVGAHQSQVYGYLVRCGLDPSARDDLFQDIFLKVHKALPNYPEDQPIKPWLFTIAANTVRSHFRKQKIRQIVSSSSDTVERTADEQPSSEQLASAMQTATWLDDALQRLPVPQREAILLVCVEGLKIREAAESLGIPEGTVKTHLRRGRMTLASGLAKRNARRKREVAP